VKAGALLFGAWRRSAAEAEAGAQAGARRQLVGQSPSQSPLSTPLPMARVASLVESDVDELGTPRTLIRKGYRHNGYSSDEEEPPSSLYAPHNPTPYIPRWSSRAKKFKPTSAVVVCDC